MIGPFRSYISRISFKTTIFTKLHIVVDSAFSPARWFSIRTNNEVLFIKVLESPLSYDFLKQIELDDIVDSMKKF